MEEIIRKKQLVDQVDKKINDLSSVVISLDVKMETQMQRKALIEKMEKKVDGLDFFIEEANMKIAKVSKKIDFQIF